MNCDLQSQQYSRNVLQKLVFLLHLISNISHIYPIYPTNDNKKLCPVFCFQLFFLSQTLFNFFFPVLNFVQLFFAPPELCSTFFPSLIFVQLTQLLTLAPLFRLHMCLSCDTASLHLKKCNMISFQRDNIMYITI